MSVIIFVIFVVFDVVIVVIRIVPSKLAQCDGIVVIC